ncbi:MAG: hypothetical protein ACMVP2_03905 [Imperialibacter sp.]|uniref:hypothetical protein n=1 Tax=Imperialibacter sp. TaxID=2038411 RepID=UPI003A883CBF
MKTSAMKKTMKSIFAMVAILFVTSAIAHQPDISSFTLIEKEPGQWMLQLNASMTAFQYEVRNAYGLDSYASAEEFNQLLLTHLKGQIDIRVNDREVTLENGMVMLGHATTVAFELSGVPGNVEEVFVKNKGFQNIYHSQGLFSIVKEGLARSRFVLSEANDYQLNVTLKDNEILLAETASNDFGSVLVIILIVGLSAVFLFNYQSVIQFSEAQTHGWI